MPRQARFRISVVVIESKLSCLPLQDRSAPDDIPIMDSNGSPVAQTIAMPVAGLAKPPPAAKMFFVGDTLARHYRIERILGSGGGGVVYLCSKAGQQGLLAVKVPYLPSLTDPKDLMRFHSEGRAARRVKSPFVVRTYDLLLDDGVLALIMEYVPGISLGKFINESQQEAERMAWRVLTQVALGLEAVHLHKIVHHDLKPANVLLDEDFNCKITDFGVARLLSQKPVKKEKADFVGTVDYVSPEVVEGRQADARSDIYSWAVIGYRLLAGKLPFEAKSPYARLLEKTTKDVPDLAVLNPTAPRSLVEIIMRNLSRDPEKRVESASLLVNALSESFSTEETMVVRDSSTMRAVLQRDKIAEAAPSAVRGVLDRLDDLSFYISSILPARFQGRGRRKDGS